MGQKLAGKVALVTGSSKGIGASIAQQLAKDGASVIVNYATSKTDAQKVVSQITQNGGKASAIQANIANPKEIEKLFSEASKLYGKIDILVNNAGIYEFAPIEELTLDSYNKTFDLNVRGILFVIKEALPYFRTPASIINISSIASTSSLASGSVYSASKAAVDAITRSLSKELAPKNIRVNSINPGMIETEGTHSAGILESDFRKNVESQTPLGRIGRPSDIAPMVAFLASDDASWITGECIFITGGLR